MHTSSLSKESEVILTFGGQMRWFWIVLKHKWFVLVEGIKLGGIPLWRLLIHDLSKFMPSEFLPYQRQFVGDKSDPWGYAAANLHHQNFNKHHWEYWIMRSNFSKVQTGSADNCLPMPEIYVREMVADWLGTARSYPGRSDVSSFLHKKYHKMKMHPLTVERLMSVLDEIGVSL